MLLARAAAVALLVAACTGAPSVASPTPSPASTTAVSTPSAASSPAPSATVSPRASAALVGSAIFGYRISLPAGYRLARSQILTGNDIALGGDTYTTLSEAEERAECAQDRGDIPSPSTAAYLIVTVYRNTAGVSAVDWSRSRPQNLHRTVEPVTIDGRPAAKLVGLGATEAYVMAANDRLYELTPTLWPSQHPLDAIAASFTAITPAPFPTPAPTPAGSPRDRAALLARSLTAAFAAKDADAVGRLATSGCWIGFGATVAGTPTGGAVNRALANFIPALRQKFAEDLAVNVDPAVQTDPRGGTFFVRSEWIERDRRTPIDLWLQDMGGGDWRWIGAMHYYDRYAANNCIPYRSPWITPTPGTCSP